MSITNRLTTTAAITRPARTADGQGGYTIVDNSVGNISCRISTNNRRGSEERNRAGREEGLGHYTIFTLTTADIKVGDTLSANSLSYEILSIVRPSRGNHLQFQADLIEPRS